MENAIGAIIRVTLRKLDEHGGELSNETHIIEMTEEEAAKLCHLQATH